MNKSFHYNTITKELEGAIIAEGDIIEMVEMPGVKFCGEWEVYRINGKLGIIWGYKKEFTPFKNFSPKVIFKKK